MKNLIVENLIAKNSSCVKSFVFYYNVIIIILLLLVVQKIESSLFSKLTNAQILVKKVIADSLFSELTKCTNFRSKKSIITRDHEI